MDSAFSCLSARHEILQTPDSAVQTQIKNWRKKTYWSTLDITFLFLVVSSPDGGVSDVCVLRECARVIYSRCTGVLKCRHTHSVFSALLQRIWKDLIYVFVICSLYQKTILTCIALIFASFLWYCVLHSMDIAFDSIAMHLLGTVSVNIFKSIWKKKNPSINVWNNCWVYTFNLCLGSCLWCPWGVVSIIQKKNICGRCARLEPAVK